jgi:hypothetical protein
VCEVGLDDANIDVEALITVDEMTLLMPHASEKRLQDDLGDVVQQRTAQ